MLRIAALVLSAIFVSVTGCIADGPFGSQRFKVIGMAVESQITPGDFVCCHLDDVTVRADSIVRDIEVDDDDLIEADGIVKLNARQFEGGVFFNYDVLMGPNPLSGDTVAGWFENSDPTARLASNGWQYLEGIQPRSKTEWVSTEAEGSAIVVQRVSDLLQRVFFLDGVQAVVTCNGNAAITSTLNVADTYIDIGPGCAFSAPLPLDVAATPVAVQDFIDYARAAADACGLGP